MAYWSRKGKARMKNTWMVIANTGETTLLVEMLGADAAEAKALAIGTRELAEECAATAREVHWVATDGPADNYANNVADYLVQQGAQAVIGYATPGVRAALGKFAAAREAQVVSNVIAASAAADGAHLSVDHLIIDSRSIETLDVPTPTCLLVNPIGFQPPEVEPRTPQGAIETVPTTPDATVELIASEPIPSSGVETADYVVGVGRGASTQTSFANAQQLASKLGAELSGSMPGVRDFGNFPEDAAYIGYTGVNLSAKVYFALGISGSTPHLIGTTNAQKVVCINNDPNARLFDHSDYGIVGDVDEVAPEIIRALF